MFVSAKSANGGNKQILLLLLLLLLLTGILSKNFELKPNLSSKRLREWSS